MTSIHNFKCFVRTMPLLSASDGKTNNDFAQSWGEGTEVQNCFLKDPNYYQTKFQDLSAGGPRTLVRLHHGHQ